MTNRSGFSGNKWGLIFLILVVLFFSMAIQTFAYKSDPLKYVHQYIANESKAVWADIPSDIKNHINNSLNKTISNHNYDTGEDIIDGSGEEDYPPLWMKHFWEPDNPQSGNYNEGLNYLGQYDSSYSTAVDYWVNNVLPYYMGKNVAGNPHAVDQDRAYYWLGRIVHLLEDATVPAHMHLDIHAPGYGDDSLEEYTGNPSVFSTYHGTTYSGNQYNYESLPNTAEINWNSVTPSGLSQDQLNLFKLFWYTAQKTQYFASDDVDGNAQYNTLNDLIIPFSTSLLQGDGVTIVNNNNYLRVGL